MSKSTLATRAQQLRSWAESTDELFDAADSILKTWEYSHDRIVPSFSETLIAAAELAESRELSPEEFQDCLAMATFLSDAVVTLTELRSRLAERVNKRGPFVRWETKRISKETPLPWEVGFDFVNKR